MGDIGSRIAERRRELRLTQLGLAKIVDVVLGAVCQWEAGKTVPNDENMPNYILDKAARTILHLGQSQCGVTKC